VSTAAASRWIPADLAYVARWQLRSIVSPARPHDYHSGTRAAVLILPGIYETWQFMEPIIEALHRNGHPVHVLPSLKYNRAPVARAAALVGSYLAEHDLRETVIVAHSKGGLIGKYAMLRADPEGRIRHMVAICTPFSGSHYARFALAPSLRTFSPTHATTRLLIREATVNARITSVFGTFDPLIPAGSVLPGARNVRLDVPGHFRILGDPMTIDTVLAEVARSDPSPPPVGLVDHAAQQQAEQVGGRGSAVTDGELPQRALQRWAAGEQPDDRAGAQ
jgi:triacylglycerol lipase